MATAPAPEDLVTASFFGFWTRPPGARGEPGQAADLAANRRQHLYLGLAHWYEAAKYMPHRPDLRDAVLLTPTPAEARKFGRKNQKEWRSDWKMVRYSVLVAGLGMLTLQRPELQLRTMPLKSIGVALQPLAFPDSFVADCLRKFDVWRKAPRIAVLGAEAAPESVVGTRMAKLVAPLPNWTLVSPCHRRTAWRLHDWALYHFVPVEYHGGRDGRQSRVLTAQMIDAADHIVVFEQRRAKRFDHAIAQAKALKRKLSLELYDAEGADASQLAIA